MPTPLKTQAATAASATVVEIKRVSYAYNSALEAAGQAAYFLDIISLRDGQAIVDQHGSFKSRREFMEAITEVLPVLDAAAAAPQGDQLG